MSNPLLWKDVPGWQRATREWLDGNGFVSDYCLGTEHPRGGDRPNRCEGAVPFGTGGAGLFLLCKQDAHHIFEERWMLCGSHMRRALGKSSSRTRWTTKGYRGWTGRLSGDPDGPERFYWTELGCRAT